MVVCRPTSFTNTTLLTVATRLLGERGNGLLVAGLHLAARRPNRREGQSRHDGAGPGL
jgi:hypothetical protein